jgi:RNA polymerase sigma-70 factor (ECF subfamily)
VLQALRASQTGPITAGERREEQERLRAALAALPEDQREVVLLHHFHERSLQEVADATRRSVKAVRTLLARARYALGTALEAAAEPPA